MPISRDTNVDRCLPHDDCFLVDFNMFPLFFQKSISNKFQNSQTYNACNAENKSEKSMDLSFCSLQISPRASSKAFQWRIQLPHPEVNKSESLH